MIQFAREFQIPSEQAIDRTAPQRTRSPRIWGLSARQVHDAFWRSKGVQCVRRGRRQKLQRGADLFLLLEPKQLALFQIAEIAERLTWHNAIVTRLRLLEEDPQHYSERVITDESGYVQRIERRYRPQVKRCARVILTSSRRVASIWMASKSRREGCDRVRRSVAWPRVDHWKAPGLCFLEYDDQQERQLIEALVECWRRPDQAISGLEEIEPGVWHVAGESVRAGSIYIGPLWLGQGHGQGDERCLVGPACIDDRREVEDPLTRAALIKDIVDVEGPDGIERRESTAGRWYPLIKRLCDAIASLTALTCLMPVMAIVALCILLEDGRPILFGHRRQGRGGRVFRCWKFRTMHRNAEQIARQLQSMNIADGPQVHIPNDPRVTRIGRILRATNLDELPQFWNVLLGQMSLVGPRPSPDDENQYCPAWRDLRLSVRPGITGLWQLNRTREPGEDFQEWIKYDIQYVQRAGLRMDLAIMMRTAWMMLLKRRKTSAGEQAN
jgi:lipopolysaccharide/colanic/teichoic acid biosynthesis glycosyltransferase